VIVHLALDSANVGAFLLFFIVIGVIAWSLQFIRASQYKELENLRERSVARLRQRGDTRFETIEFPNNAMGQATKNAVLAEARSLGWVIVSESVAAGHFKGGEACCLAVICLPLGFLAGRTDGSITVTLGWESPPE